MIVDPRFVAWCAACEWNADHDQAPARKFFARLAARQADWLARRLYADISSHPRTRRRGIAVLSLAYVLAGAVHLITVALVVATVLLFRTAIVWPFKFVFAALLLGLAWEVQPFHRRTGRRVTPRLDRAAAAELFGLIDEVAAAIGAPTVGDVVVLPDYNAFYFLLSRRKPAIGIGRALWAVLEPQERVALLGHELGHRVNGDLRRQWALSAALVSLRRWRRVLLPAPRRARLGAGGVGGLVQVVEMLLVPAILIPLSALIGVVGDLLHLVVQRQGQRCEYYADELAARAGGSAGAIGLTEKLLIADACLRVVTQTIKFRRASDPWDTVGEFARSIPASEWDRRRLNGRRRLHRIDVSHPPSMFRADLLRSRPDRPAVVTLPSDRSAAIDAELASATA